VSTFIGIDLAWTTSNNSGICQLEGETSTDLNCCKLEAAVRSTQDLADEIAATPGRVIVAIDAPLLYTPKRWAEQEISRQFARHKASAHSAHEAVRQGRTAGIDLGVALQKRGFTLDPAALDQLGQAGQTGQPGQLEQDTGDCFGQNLHGCARRGQLGQLGQDTGDCRVAFEVYPHTIHVRLFNLAQRLPYKAKKGRSVAYRRNILKQYQNHLRQLVQSEAPNVLNNAAVRHALSPETVECAKGAALKHLEDQLDGLTCAMAAWLAWISNDTWETLGDSNGYIVVPQASSP